MPNLRGWEWLILVALILLLFGAKRLPDAARGLGRSLRIFKAETKGLTEDDQGAASPPQQIAQQQAAQQQAMGGQAPAAPIAAADAASEGQTPPAQQQ